MENYTYNQELYIKVNGNSIKNKEMENINFKMEIIMKVNGKIIRCQGTAYTINKHRNIIKVFGKMIYFGVVVQNIIKMELNWRDIGFKIN